MRIDDTLSLTSALYVRTLDTDPDAAVPVVVVLPAVEPLARNEEGDIEGGHVLLRPHVFIAVLIATGLTAAGSGEAASSEDTTEKGATWTITEPTGEPLRVMMIIDTGPGQLGDIVRPGTEAAAQAINASGGVNGRPIEIVVCDGRGDVNAQAECAREAASDPTILATVGNDTYTGGPSIMPILEEAGMAAIGTMAYGPVDFNSPSAFLIAGGGAASSAGAVASFAARGDTQIVRVALQSAAAAATDDFINNLILAPYGIELARRVEVPSTATDLSAFAADAIRDNPDVIALGLPPSLAFNMIRALRQQGYEGTIGASGVSNTAEDLEEAVGEVAGDLVVSGAFSHAGERYPQYLAEMDAFDPDAGPVDQAANGWLSVHLFADIVSEVSGEITRESIVEALSELRDYDTGGFTPPLDFTAPGAHEDFSRLVNPSVIIFDYSPGEFVEADPPVFTNWLTGQPIDL